MSTLATTAQLPWIASNRSARWLALGVAVIIAALVAVGAVLLRGQTRSVFCGAMWCLAIAVWWLLVVPNALWMARDATALRLPGIRHTANVSVMLHALVSVLLPALVLGVALGYPTTILVGFVLTAAACMTFLLLPGWAVLALWVAWMLLAHLLAQHHWLQVDAPTFPALVADLAVPTLLLIVFLAWRWLRLLDAEPPDSFTWAAPSIWNLRRQSMQTFLGTPDRTLARAVPKWFAPVADLRGTGPRNPVRSIRVALGRGLMPQTWGSRLRQWGYSLGFLALVLVLNFSQSDIRHGLGYVWGWMVPMMIGILAVVMPISGHAIQLQKRWCGHHAELPVLALLPGLATRQDLKRSMLQACLTRSWVFGLIAWLALCGCAIISHDPAELIAYGALCTLAGAGLGTAAVLGTLGGRPLSDAVTTGFILGLVILASLSLTLGVAYLEAAPIFLGLWAIALGTIAMLSLRGWRDLQRRPHPFLANGP